MLQAYFGLVPHFSRLEIWSVMLAQSSGDLKNECSSGPFTQYALVACIAATLCLSFCQLPLLFYDAVCQCAYSRWQDE